MSYLFLFFKHTLKVLFKLITFSCIEFSSLLCIIRLSYTYITPISFHNKMGFKLSNHTPDSCKINVRTILFCGCVQGPIKWKKGRKTGELSRFKWTKRVCTVYCWGPMGMQCLCEVSGTNSCQCLFRVHFVYHDVIILTSHTCHWWVLLCILTMGTRSIA